MRARLILVLTLTLSGQAYAGAFDGKWDGKSFPVVGCPEISVVLTVENNAIVSGLLSSGSNSGAISGSIGQDGAADVVIGTRKLSGKFKFTGNEFEGNTQTLTCSSLRFIKGTRVNP